MLKVLQRRTAMLAVIASLVRHGRTGSDADLPMEEGRTIPAAG